jgi:hypothetical protein
MRRERQCTNNQLTGRRGTGSCTSRKAYLPAGQVQRIGSGRATSSKSSSASSEKTSPT